MKYEFCSAVWVRAAREFVLSTIPLGVSFVFFAGPATSVFSLLALGFYLRYQISRERHRVIISELATRKTA